MLIMEGAEMDLVAGPQTWLLPANRFVVEVTTARILPLLEKNFATVASDLSQIDQRALPFVGHENRREENCWRMSESSPVPQ
jgi:hypothetical protein